MTKEKTVFQSKVDKNLLKEFRTVQQSEGRTTKFLVEKFMLDHITEFNNRTRYNYDQNKI